MQGVHLRKYGVAGKVDFVLYEVDGVDFRTDWTPADGDVIMMRDEAAEEQVTNASGNANLSTLVTDEGRGYSITLALEDMQAKRIEIFLVDQATKVFLDWTIIIETYGHASAQHAFDLDLATQGVNVVSEADIDFGATKKTSLNAATPDLSAITGDKASYKATGFSTLSTADIIAALEDSGLTLVTTTIATLASQTSFTLTAGSADNNAYVGCIAIIEDVSTAAQKAVGLISAYTGASLTITLAVDPGIFTMATTDKIRILPWPKDLSATMKTSVNTEMVDTLNVDTYAEPGQEAPAATTSLVKKIGLLYKYARNKITNDGTDTKVYNDAGSVVDQKASVSESGGTVTRDKFETGP